MADGNHRPHNPINRRNYSSSSSSYSNPTKPFNPNYRRPSNPSSDSSRINYTKRTTTRSCESDDSMRNDKDDDHQEFPSLVGTCPFMCPGISITPLSFIYFFVFCSCWFELVNWRLLQWRRERDAKGCGIWLCLRGSMGILLKLHLLSQ